MKPKRPADDSDPHWTGWTRSLDAIPLKQIEEDGYTVKELEDSRGRYWLIIKKITTRHET